MYSFTIKQALSTTVQRIRKVVILKVVKGHEWSISLWKLPLLKQTIWEQWTLDEICTATILGRMLIMIDIINARFWTDCLGASDKESSLHPNSHKSIRAVVHFVQHSLQARTKQPSFHLFYFSVCKRWNTIAKDNSLWRYIDLTDTRLDLKKAWKCYRARLSECLISFKLKGYYSSNGKILFRTRFNFAYHPYEWTWRLKQWTF